MTYIRKSRSLTGDCKKVSRSDRFKRTKLQSTRETDFSMRKQGWLKSKLSRTKEIHLKEQDLSKRLSSQITKDLEFNKRMKTKSYQLKFLN